MPKTAFVTGGTGFIGSHLVEALLHSGYSEVRCLVRSNLKWLDGLDIVPVFGDLTKSDILRDALRDVDYVYHVAGITRAKDWETLERSNIFITTALLEVVHDACPDVKKVLITSSLAAVGFCQTAVSDEETPLNPISLYGKSKAEMERAIRNLTLPVVIVRPPAVYGPREADIFTFFKLINLGICPVIGSPSIPSMTLIHVRDLVRGMIQAAEAEGTGGETYCIGTERFYTWNDIKTAAAAALGKRAVTITVPKGFVNVLGTIVETIGKPFGAYPAFNREKAREFNEANKMCSTEKARRDFGYRQQISLKEGFRETIDWYRAHGWL